MAGHQLQVGSSVKTRSLVLQATKYYKSRVMSTESIVPRRVTRTLDKRFCRGIGEYSTHEKREALEEGPRYALLRFSAFWRGQKFRFSRYVIPARSKQFRITFLTHPTSVTDFEDAVTKVY